MQRSADLHPALGGWFRSRFEGLSEIQRRALEHTAAGRHTLILAPTGSGKTLAAFLSILSTLAHEAEGAGLPNATSAVYVSPLRSLTRDIQRNLEPPLAAINEALPERRRIRMEVRTGDTEFIERSRQQRRHPHLLLTTPESLSALLSQKGWRGGFAVRTAVVDEIHAFAENKRGSLLTLALERLETQSAGPLQRIGLSATARPVEAVACLLCGAREYAVAEVDARKAHRLDIASPPAELRLPAAGYGPYRIAPLVADLVKQAQCTLAFTATRSAAERLGLALKILLPEFEDDIEVHHASVDRDARLKIEARLAAGALKAVVCSSSLELGVDFSGVDQVLLIGAPRGVSRALQRLGRSGHRIDGVAEGALAPLSLPDVLECIALREAAREGRLDELKPPRAPLDVLAQALLGMSVERRWGLDEAYDVVRRAGPYLELSRADFDAVIEYLAGGGKVLGPYGTYGKIVVSDGGFEAASARVARAYYMNIGAISDEFQLRVVGRGNRGLGTVEEDFLGELQPGDAFIIGGKAVRLKRLHQNTAMVEPAKGERVKTPRWLGGKMPLSAQLAHEELRLRQALRRAFEQGGKAACRAMLEREWGAPARVAEIAAAYVARQYRAGPVPTDAPVEVERVRDARTMLIVFHSVAGRAINRALAWVAGARLAGTSSVVANFDDHSFLLSLDARKDSSEAQLRTAFRPAGWEGDLRCALESTETLGRKFRHIAETGQLLPRRSPYGNVSKRASSWSASLLYTTLLKHEPDHPLVRETVREVLEDQLDAARAAEHAARIYAAEWAVRDHPRPSPFALPLFAFFNREVLIAQDPDRALDDLVASMYEEWSE